MKHLLPILALPLIAACATANTPPAEDPPLPPAADAECDTGEVQDRIGDTATAQLGEALLQATGARSLRWIPPRSAVTMDYRPDRLNVSYDDSFTITRIRCG